MRRAAGPALDVQLPRPHRASPSFRRCWRNGTLFVCFVVFAVVFLVRLHQLAEEARRPRLFSADSVAADSASSGGFSNDHFPSAGDGQQHVSSGDGIVDVARWFASAVNLAVFEPHARLLRLLDAAHASVSSSVSLLGSGNPLELATQKTAFSADEKETRNGGENGLEQPVSVLVLIAVKLWRPADLSSRLKRWADACSSRRVSSPPGQRAYFLARCDYVVILPAEFTDEAVESVSALAANLTLRAASSSFGDTDRSWTSRTKDFFVVRVQHSLASGISEFHDAGLSAVFSDDDEDISYPLHRLHHGKTEATHLLLTTANLAPDSRFFVENLLLAPPNMEKSDSMPVAEGDEARDSIVVISACSIVMFSGDEPDEGSSGGSAGSSESCCEDVPTPRLIVDQGAHVIESRAAGLYAGRPSAGSVMDIVRPHVGKALQWSPSLLCTDRKQKNIAETGDIPDDSNMADGEEEDLPRSSARLVSPYCALVPLNAFLWARRELRKLLSVERYSAAHTSLIEFSHFFDAFNIHSVFSAERKEGFEWGEAENSQKAGLGGGGGRRNNNTASAPLVRSAANILMLKASLALLRGRIVASDAYSRLLDPRELIRLSADPQTRLAMKRLNSALRSAIAAHKQVAGLDLSSAEAKRSALESLAFRDLPDSVLEQEQEALLRRLFGSGGRISLEAHLKEEASKQQEEISAVSLAAESLLGFTLERLVRLAYAALSPSNTSSLAWIGDEQGPWWAMQLLLRNRRFSTSDRVRIRVSSVSSAFVLPSSLMPPPSSTSRKRKRCSSPFLLVTARDVAHSRKVVQGVVQGSVFPPSLPVDASLPLFSVRVPMLMELLRKDAVDARASNLFRTSRELQVKEEKQQASSLQETILLLSSSLERLRVIWYVVCCRCCGFSNEVELFIAALDPLIHVYLPVEEKCFCNGSQPTVADTLQRRRVHPSDVTTSAAARTVWISHTSAKDYAEVRASAGRLGAQYFIGRSMSEYSRISPLLVNVSNNVPHEIWVPSEFVYNAFRRSGVATRMTIVPEPIDVDLFDPDAVQAMRLPPAQYRHQCNRRPPPHSDDVYVFFSDFKWEPRKGWEILFEAYFTAFRRSSGRDEDQVVLYVLTHLFFFRSSGLNEHDTDFIFHEIESKVRDRISPSMAPSEVPTFCIIADRVDGRDMPSLYKAMNAFVLPTRGEGWGLPAAQALAMRLPVISTAWGGSLAFLKESHAYLIPIERLEDVPQNKNEDGDDGDEMYSSSGGASPQWAVPSLGETIRLLRHVRENKQEAERKGRRGRRYAAANFSPSAVAMIVARRLAQISENNRTVT
jgi:glycosyltransferase involved in cell wall biosynthesis